jgi:hypothetical protein
MLLLYKQQLLVVPDKVYSWRKGVNELLLLSYSGLVDCVIICKYTVIPHMLSC